MAIFLEIMAHLLTLGAAGVAIVGNTWDETKKGWKKLTKTGIFAAVFAVFGVSLAAFQSYDKHVSVSAYKNIALEDLRGGWRQSAYPVMRIVDMLDGDDNKDQISLESFERLAASGMPPEFEEMDFSAPIDLPQAGDPPLYAFVCQGTQIGMTIMHREVEENAELLSHRIATKLAAIRKGGFIPKLFQSCREVAEKRSDPDHLKEVFLNGDDFKDYIATLLDLGEAIGDPLTRDGRRPSN